MKTLLYYFFIIFQINIYSQDFGEINGSVYDSSTREPLINASINISNTNFEAKTDFDENFLFKRIPVSLYKFKASYIGYASIQIENIKVGSNKNSLIYFALPLDTIKKHGVLDSATISFIFYLTENKLLTQDDILIEYKDSIFNYSIVGSDFFTDEHLVQPHTIKYETCRNGSFSVSFKLKKYGEIVSTGTISLPLEKDWNMKLNFFIKDENPLKGCFGCRGYKAFPIIKEFRKTANDSLYIIWSGNYIANPVVY